MTSALALFGNGSWLNIAAEYMSNYTYNGTYQNGDYLNEDLTWPLFWRGMPLSNLWAPSPGIGDLVSLCDNLEQRIFDNVKPTNHDLFELAEQLFAFFAPGFNGGKDQTPNQSLDQKLNQTLHRTQDLLEVVMFVANRAVLTLFATDTNLTGRFIRTSPGVAVPRPVLSRSSVIIMSVLIGLQLLGLVYLTYYLYRIPSWSNQLDAMAMARIGASLDHRGVLPAIGPVSKEDLITVQTVGGLIRIFEKSPRQDSSASESVLPEMAAADDSAVELQRLTSSEEGRKSVEDDTTSVKLELGASGPILTADLPGHTALSFGLKKAWSKVFASWKQPSVDDLPPPPPPTSPRSETSTNLPTLTLLPSLSFSTRQDDDGMSFSE